MDVDKLLIITHDEEEMIVEDGKEIAVVPIWKWLLNRTVCWKTGSVDRRPEGMD